MANINIGHIRDPHTGDLAVVRQDKRGKFYYYSIIGKITPNLPKGQEWIKQNATIWKEPDQPPAGIELISGEWTGQPPTLKTTAAPKTETKPETKPAKKSPIGMLFE